MLCRNGRATVIVVQILQTHKQNNVAYIKYHTTFKETAINFLEKKLKNNTCSNGTPFNLLKNVMNNNVAIATSTYVNHNAKSLTDFEKIKKREMLDALTDFMQKLPIYSMIHTINDIDIKCCNLLDVMSYDDIFKLSLFFTKTVPDKITRMNFYNTVTELLREGILNGVFNKNEIIFCFYLIGLKKKDAAKDIKMILKSLKFDELLLYEICIIAETAFKCGVKLPKTRIEDIEKVIENEAKTLVAEIILLVPLCKVLRHGRATKNFLPCNLSKELVKKSGMYQMIPAVHVLKLYADIYFAEITVLKRLVTDIMARISLANQEYKSKQGLYRSQIYEPKYIDGFLWTICLLNYKLTDVQLLEITTFLDSMQFNLFNKPLRLLRILLSLWILGYQAEFMIQECIKRNIFLEAHNAKFWKLRTALSLLFQIIQIESPNIELPKKLSSDVYVALDIPRSVKLVSMVISGFSKKMKLQNVIINCPVKGIYIAGVSFDHSTLGSFHVDVLNDTTCLRFQKSPHGFTNLKLRLLKQLGYQSILIDEDYMKDTVAALEYIEKRLYEIVYTK